MDRSPPGSGSARIPSTHTSSGSGPSSGPATRPSSPGPPCSAGWPPARTPEARALADQLLCPVQIVVQVLGTGRFRALVGVVVHPDRHPQRRLAQRTDVVREPTGVEEDQLARGRV